MRSFREGKNMSARLQEEGFNAGGVPSLVCPGCGVFLEPSGLLLTGDEIQCCSDHGCFVVGPTTFWSPQPMRNEDLPRFTVEAQRHALSNAFACLLAGGAGDYLIVYDLDSLPQYMQLELQGNCDGAM